MDPTTVALYLCIFIISAAVLHSQVNKRISYRYSSIPPGHNNIRLLRLLPNKDETAPIKCQLFNYTIESGKRAHLYDALSYAWGNPDETLPIFVGEHRVKVTRNLHMALLRLRTHFIERIVWVDAVCINQADDQEKAHQIQHMTKIYNQANRVIIWLGEATEDSDAAFEDIRKAAGDEAPNSLVEADQKKIINLLERPWFRRIWVLQEVAAARCILIMCGPTEMDGYAFCLGLSKLELSYEGDSDLQGLIRSVTYLIQGAMFRPRYAMNNPGGPSLGELIDMFHTRKATKRHDKIYALLGMSLEGPSATSLLPNYQVSWKDTLEQLVRFLLHKDVSVETWNEKEIAVIKTKGCILGRVSLVESDVTRYGRQHLTIIFQNTTISLKYKEKCGDRWTLQASAKPIRKGDIVCLLQGAPKPTIIRPRKDHFAVIVITVPVKQDLKLGHGYLDRQDYLSSKEKLSRDFLLSWNWDEFILNLQGRASDETLIEVSTLVSEYSMAGSKKSTRLNDMVLILQDLKDYEEAGKRLQEIVKMHEGSPTEQHLNKLAAKENSAIIYKEKKEWKEAQEQFLEIVQERKTLQEIDHPDTLRSIAYLASAYTDQRGVKKEKTEMIEDILNRIKGNLPIPEEEVVYIVKSFGREILPHLLNLKRDHVLITEKVVKAAAEDVKTMTLLFDQRGDDIQITEEVVKAAAGHKRVMELLLDRRDDIPITEDVVEAVIGHWSSGEEVMALLLDRRGDEIQVTEELVRVAGKELCGKKVIMLLLDRRADYIQITEELVVQVMQSFDEEVMTLFLDRRGNDIQITEEVVIAAVEKDWRFGKSFVALFDRRGDDIPITEEVVKAAAGNEWGADEIMALLLDRRGADVQITEEVLKAAVGNDRSGIHITTLLLNRRGDYISITEEVVKAAVGNEELGEKVIELLLDRRGEEVLITEEVIKAAIRNWKYGKEIMTILLDRKGTDIQITEDVVKTAAERDWRSGRPLMTLLDQRGDYVLVTEKVVKAAAGNDQSGNEAMKLLLNRSGADIQITEEVVKAALRNARFGKELITLLRERGGENIPIPITKELVQEAVGNEEGGHHVISLLLEQCADKPHMMNMITNADVVKVAATCGQERVLDLLHNHYKFEHRTTWIGVARIYNAAKHGYLDDVRRLLQEGVVPDLKNIRGVTPLWQAASRGHTAVVKALLATDAVDVNSQSALGRTPLFWPSAHGNAKIVRLLLDKGAHPHCEDIYSETPITAARQNRRIAVVKLLTNYSHERLK